MCWDALRCAKECKCVLAVVEVREDKDVLGRRGVLRLEGFTYRKTDAYEALYVKIYKNM